jgi:hypothetical protein
MKRPWRCPNPASTGEVVAEFQAGREAAERVDRGEDVDPGDVADAINGLRSLFEYVVVEPESP